MLIDTEKFIAERERLLQANPTYNRKSFCKTHWLNKDYFTKIVKRGKIWANALKKFMLAWFALEKIQKK